MTPAAVPISIDDPVNAAILSVSEDKLAGFHRDPIGQIAQRTDLDADTVLERITAMLTAGTIRRVRQTLITTSLAPGALVAWAVPPDKLNHAFDFMFNEDPFSGHVVLRSTDRECPGSEFKLWTTLKVPLGFSMTKHCDFLARHTGAEKYVLLPAKKLFALGVGHVRRRTIEPGERTDEPARVMDTEVVKLTHPEWRVLEALKREFEPHELKRDLWTARAAEARVSLDEFFELGASLDQRHLVGRFSTFLEHVKKLQDGSTVTRYNALFHWAVPHGSEMVAGMEVGRHLIMTHAYWREAGPAFNDVNIMGVAHGTDKQRLLAHKAAIDTHLHDAGVHVDYTNVFWGGRSEIKPSEISPIAYRNWCEAHSLNPRAMD